LAGLKSAGILVEILNEDGTMARLPELAEVAKEFELKLISIEDLVAYRMQHDSLIEKKEDFEVKTRFGEYRLRAYQQTTNDQVHLALSKGNWKIDEPVLVRVNSTLVNNDILGTLTNDADKKLDDMFKALNKEESGAIVFINQEDSSMNLLKRLTGLREVQKEGEMKAPRIKMDNKDFGIGAQILHDLGIHKIKLLSNSDQQKRVGMIGYGLEIVEYKKY
jgi:3,4-dihydroxy 2-butanone 4-phosphate synthase/GTP cyclohydrolase II